jgi:hypothetical protein
MSPSLGRMSANKILAHRRLTLLFDVYFRRKDSSKIGQAKISFLTSRTGVIVRLFRWLGRWWPRAKKDSAKPA